MDEQITPVTTQWQWRTYKELTRDEAVAMFKLRQDVFIVEQDCAFPDIDGLDSLADHLLGWQSGQLVATLRLFDAFEPYDDRCSLGRICSSQSVRGSGVGQALVAQGLAEIDRRLPERETEIGAQLYLERFYQGFGFVTCSDVYLEDGIEHVHMRRPPRNLKQST